MTPNEMRKEARHLEGMFNLHDYCDNAMRMSWLDKADRLRKQADEIEKKQKRAKTEDAARERK